MEDKILVPMTLEEYLDLKKEKTLEDDIYNLIKKHSKDFELTKCIDDINFGKEIKLGFHCRKDKIEATIIIREKQYEQSNN